MKNLLILICLFCTGSTLSGQTEAGKLLIGTSTNLYGISSVANTVNLPNTAGFIVASSQFKSDSFESDVTTSSNFNISPRVGFFAADKLLFGLDAGFGVTRTKEDDETISSTSIGPFIRYYLKMPGFRPFVQAGGNIGQIRVNDGDFEFKTNTVSYGAGIGGAFFLNEHIAVDLLINYMHLTMKEKEAEDKERSVNNLYGFSFGFSFFL